MALALSLPGLAAGESAIAAGPNGGLNAGPPLQSNYTQVANGNGGYNYFYNGNPITVQAYGAAKGMSPAQISALSAQGQPSSSAPAAQPNSPDTSGSGSSTANPSLAESYATQAQEALDQLGNEPTSLANQLSSIGSTIQNSTNAENNAFGQDTAQFNQQEQQDQTNEGLTQDQIASSTRNNMNGTQRLLGLAGAGNSSAAEIAAPYLVNQQGAQAGNAAQTTYGQNQQAMDLAFNGPNGTAAQHKLNLTNLANSEFAQDQQAKGAENAQIAQYIQQAIGDIGNAGYFGNTSMNGQVPALNTQEKAAQAAGAGYQLTYANPINPITPVAYAAPTLASFASGVAATPTTNSINTPAAQAATNVAVAPTTPANQQQNPLLQKVS